MRALLLTALLVPAAAAQDVRIVPAPGGAATPLLIGEDRCDAPRTMPTPFATDPTAAELEVEWTGPEPVAMPNLCAATPGLAAAVPYDLGRFPEMDYEQFRNAPPAVRERLPFRFDRPPRRAVPDIDPDVLERYLETLPPGTDLFDLLASPEAGALVAPLGDRE